MITNETESAIDHSHDTVVNRRAVLQAMGAGTVGLPALANVGAAQEDYEPEVVVRFPVADGIVFARPEEELPPAEEINYTPDEGGGELGAEIAETIGGITDKRIAVEKTGCFRVPDSNEATVVPSVVVTSRTEPDLEAGPEEQREILREEGTFQNLNEQFMLALNNRVEEVRQGTAFATPVPPVDPPQLPAFPEEIGEEVSDAVSTVLETEFNSRTQGLVAQPVSATTRPREEFVPPAYAGLANSGTAVATQDWCSRVCNYFLPWWWPFAEWTCNRICDGWCRLVEWIASRFNLEDWEIDLIERYAGC